MPFKLSAEEEMSYGEVVEKFSSYFCLPPNVLDWSAKFHCRVQHADEPIDEFYAELWYGAAVSRHRWRTVSSERGSSLL